MSKTDLENIEAEYKKRLPIYGKLKKEAMFIIESELDKTKIKIHEITSRVKKTDSFLDKVKRKESKEPFKDIQDIVGLRIVCLFLSDITKIKAIIEKSFDLLSEDNKIDSSDASSFGYMSNHLIVSIRKDCSGPRYENIVGVPFEIQVRTIAQHSWATISHYLDYKTKIAIPKDLRRDFFALSGLFHVADTHFEMFFKESNISKTKMKKVFEKESPNLDQDINLDSLTAYLKMRFPDRKHADKFSLSILINEISVYNYKKIQQIDDAVAKALNVFLEIEKDNPPGRDSKYYDIAVIRGILGLVNKEYANRHFIAKRLEKYRKML